MIIICVCINKYVYMSIYTSMYIGIRIPHMCLTYYHHAPHACTSWRGGRGMEKSKLDGMFRGHLAQSYGELEAINRGGWRGLNTFWSNTLSLHNLSPSPSFYSSSTAGAAAIASSSSSNSKAAAAAIAKQQQQQVAAAAAVKGSSKNQHIQL